jgi:hypothetical protein
MESKRDCGPINRVIVLVHIQQKAPYMTKNQRKLKYIRLLHDKYDAVTKLKNYKKTIEIQANKIAEAIESLQADCEHEFVNGVCDICGIHKTQSSS